MQHKLVFLPDSEVMTCVQTNHHVALYRSFYHRLSRMQVCQVWYDTGIDGNLPKRIKMFQENATMLFLGRKDLNMSGTNLGLRKLDFRMKK